MTLQIVKMKVRSNCEDFAVTYCVDSAVYTCLHAICTLSARCLHAVCTLSAHLL